GRPGEWTRPPAGEGGRGGQGRRGGVEEEERHAGGGHHRQADGQAGRQAEQRRVADGQQVKRTNHRVTEGTEGGHCESSLCALLSVLVVLECGDSSAALVGLESAGCGNQNTQSGEGIAALQKSQNKSHRGFPSRSRIG